MKQAMSAGRNPGQGTRRISATELIHGRPTPSFGRGRVCTASGCRIHLSVYNPTDRCSLHDHPLY
jgi:hypothetical protein